tara:strand:- start:582 stop:1877 length:1296 start_codon:yes stop_codon:yes gene_type:complete
MKNFKSYLVKLIALAFIILQFSCTKTQEIKAINVGDRISMNNLKVQLESSLGVSLNSGVKDKLIILEFVSVYCGSCKTSVPHLEKLQQDFIDDLLVVLVTSQDDSLVKEKAKSYMWNLPIISEDTLLRKQFPYKAVPHQVWIKNDTVLAITGWKSATKENIQKIIKNNTLKTYLKNDDDFDISQPMVLESIKPYYQSIITPRLGAGSVERKTKDQILIQNASVKSLYARAYKMPNFPIDVYVKLETNDSLQKKINGPEFHITGNYKQDSTYIAWRDKYTFCYNLNFPNNKMSDRTKMLGIMQQDLNNFFRGYFGIEGVVAKRKVACLALVETDKLGRYKTENSNRYVSSKDDNFKFENQPIDFLVRLISLRHNDYKIPIVNDTGYSGNIKIEIKGGIGEVNNINKELFKYGLQFVEKEVEIDMVVISETTD